MGIMILFLVIGGGMSCGIFYMIYGKKRKQDKLSSSLFIKLPLVFGIINSIMAISFFLLYLYDSTLFINEENIVWNFATVLFTLFTIYFYILAPLISIGELMVTMLLKRDGIISLKYFYMSITTNAIACITLLTLTYIIFN
ncbi:hypothetical protein HZI73_25390 [Vallitalea pronyensis]|uniref:Uncharacterized protein n=1 Tax=Vallitalea pronyensis TaxID=1348613 RepID=A0A8J8SJE0_9FIRM|nr:hypothetical protein [Vallitalea pronyensis]QUI25424.1 hypothetical protein HZI73_25390 [Vallitalea pronyensis]